MGWSGFRQPVVTARGCARACVLFSVHSDSTRFRLLSRCSVLASPTVLVFLEEYHREAQSTPDKPLSLALRPHGTVVRSIFLVARICRGCVPRCPSFLLTVYIPVQVMLILEDSFGVQRTSEELLEFLEVNVLA